MPREFGASPGEQSSDSKMRGRRQLLEKGLRSFDEEFTSKSSLKTKTIHEVKQYPVVGVLVAFWANDMASRDDETVGSLFQSMMNQYTMLEKIPRMVKRIKKI